MSERRKPYMALQFQAGFNGAKIARVEFFQAKLWRIRPSFESLYPAELWDDLYRLRIEGVWWWACEKGTRYPFVTLAEAWYLTRKVASEVAGLPGPKMLDCPDLWPQVPAIAMVDGLKSRTQIICRPWISQQGIWWTRVVGGGKRPVPCSALRLPEAFG